VTQGKTARERIYYLSARERARKPHMRSLPIKSPSDYGVLVTVKFDTASTLRDRLRAASDDRREKRTPENYALLLALTAEAMAKGWRLVEITRACRCNKTTVAHWIKKGAL